MHCIELSPIADRCVEIGPDGDGCILLRPGSLIRLVCFKHEAIRKPIFLNEQMSGCDDD
jgi:hypothetical protein